MKHSSAQILTGLAAVLLFGSALADPAITGVTAQQRYPWNGKVDITYTVSGDIETIAQSQGLILKVSATDQETGTSYTASSLSGDTSLADGTHSIVWDMDADGLTLKSTNVVFPSHAKHRRPNTASSTCRRGQAPHPTQSPTSLRHPQAASMWTNTRRQSSS